MMPPKIDKGRLIQTLLVASIREKISPNPPNAVMNEQMVVGLKGERPGMIKARLGVAACPKIGMHIVPAKKMPKKCTQQSEEQPDEKTNRIN